MLYLIEVLLVLLIGYGIWNEDKLVDFERSFYDET